MKTKITCSFFALLVLVSTTISAQTHNGDLTLTTQAQVDNFNYSIVTGFLKINNSTTDPIKNVNGLSSLTEVKGERLRISADSLVSLDGLHNLKTVRGSLDLYGNKIENTNALSGLTQVLGAHILIYQCENLKHIDGLNSLSTMGDNTYIYISRCDKLVDITGFNGISTINTIQIEDCPNLESIQGFSSLQNNKSLFIVNNPELTDLSGFKNFETGCEYLSIKNNTKFDRFCDLHKLFSNNGISGNITISGNAQNPTPEEIIAAGACEKAYNGNLTLSTQTQIDTFNYNEISGWLIITDENSMDTIKNLDGLSGLKSIGNKLRIESNQITNLNGLSSLERINYTVDIGSDSLTDLSGLSALSYVGGSHFVISGLDDITELNGFESLTQISAFISISSCPKLKTVTGFNNIKTLPGGLGLSNCDSLNSITGFQSLQGVDRINIVNNSVLKDMSGFKNLQTIERNFYFTNNTQFENFCDFYNLFYNNGVSGRVTITGNAQNPISEEIIAAGACEATSVSPITDQEIVIYPNPAKNQITINCQQFIEATIYSATGAKMVTSQTPEINLQNLQSGLYMVKVKTGQGNYQTKFLKQ